MNTTPKYSRLAPGQRREQILDAANALFSERGYDELVVVGRHGELTPVVDGRGHELVLDRPTSVEFVGDTGYVVSVTGDVYRVDGL